MFSRTQSSVRPLLAILAASIPLTLSLTAGHACGMGPAADGTKPLAAGASAVQQARALADDNQLVRAKAVLSKALQRPGMSESDHDEAIALLTTIDQRLNLTDRLDLSLQKAELALSEGDVRTTEMHARAVLKNATANPTQIDRAKQLLGEADDRRRLFADAAPSIISQAERDFLAGRYAEAKVGFGAVYRSGVTLSPDRQALLDKYQTRIVSLEESRGTPFDIDAAMGVMQPGQVKKREDTPPPAQPPAAPPPAQPTNEQPANPPAEQPPVHEQPANPPPAEVQPSNDDLIRQAMRAEAQSVLRQADLAFSESRYNEAQGMYNRLRTEFRDYLSQDQLKYVDDRLTEAQIRLRAQVGPGGILENDLAKQELVRQEVRAEFQNEMRQARAALDSGDPNRAQNNLALARLKINTARNSFSNAEFQNLEDQVNALSSEIERVRQEQAIAAANAATKQSEEEAAKAERAQREERERKINELIDRARAYQLEMRYDEALQAVDQLLFLDPINPAGLILRDILGDTNIYAKYNAIERKKQWAYAANSLDNMEAAIPPVNVMNFPEDWPAISVRRGEPVQFAESPENRRILAELNSKRIPSVEFNDNSLREVLDFVHQLAQVNVDVDWPSLQEAGIEPETTVSLNLTNVSVKTVLDRVLERVGSGDAMSRADWAVDNGVVTVASEAAIRKKTMLVIYDIKDLLVEIPDYDEVPAIDLQQALQSNGGGGGGGGGGGQSPFRDDQQDQQDQQQRNLEERIDTIIEIITGNIDFEGWVDNGGDTGKIQKLVSQGALIITNTAKNHREIQGLLNKLREIRAMQINVETKFLLVNQDWFEQIGFDLDIIINSNNNQVRTARANDPTIQPNDFFDFGSGGRNPKRQITGAGVPQATQGVVNPNGWSPVGFLQDSLGLAGGLIPSQGIAADVLGGAPALGIAGQFLDDIEVDFLVQATQADRRSVQLTAPRITFTNGQISNIYVATQVAFVSDLTPVVGDSAVGFDPTVNVVTEGVTLLVEGTVTADRRYVTMNIDAGVSRIDGFAQQAVTAVAGGQLINSADTQSFIQLPTVTVTRVRTTVTVPDQGTVLMGGQRLVTEFDVETGVPVLSKIPIINRLFTNRIESKEEQTLLILVKPTILIQNEEEERNFPGLQDSLRTGFNG